MVWNWQKWMWPLVLGGNLLSGCSEGGGVPSETQSPSTPTEAPVPVPRLELDKTALTWEESVAPEDTTTVDLTVTNVGGADLLVAAEITSEEPPWFELTTDAGPLTVAPGDSTVLTVSFHPLAYGYNATGTLRLSTNDEASTVVDVPLAASSQDAPDLTETPAEATPTEVGPSPTPGPSLTPPPTDTPESSPTPPELSPTEGTSPTPGNSPTPATDGDNDGFNAADDCDDQNPAVNPGAAEICDGGDNNCDGGVDEGVQDLFYPDLDGDGFGTGDGSPGCEPSEKETTQGGDCDDTDTGSFPGAVEYCDGIDNNCDGEVDEDSAADASLWYLDGDGDGFGVDEGSAEACVAPDGFVAEQGDCNDSDPAYNPGASENNCADSNDYNCDGSVAYEDKDGDGYPACQECNDGSMDTYPGAAEICDGQDNNCDGNIDEGTLTTYYQDADGDNFGTGDQTIDACEAPSGFASNADDCNDTSNAAFPGATERCDGLDNNCDGEVDEDGAADVTTWYQDEDGDHYGNSAVSEIDCDAPTGYVNVAGDCNDVDASYYPAAPEACTDTQDYNCDGSVSYADKDNDSVPACQDCDDNNATAYPGGTEVCDGVDNDCDGNRDEGVTTNYYADGDGDGYGAGTATAACSAPTGYVTNNTDCNDSNVAINPAATETCNDRDDDCDLQVDEVNAQGCTVLYADVDGDTWGGANNTCSCTTKLGYTTKGGDCDDGNSQAYPGASEKCNAFDDDCDGTTNEAGAQGCLRFYKDQDDDTYGVNADYQCLCEEGGDYSATVGNDCLDTDNTVYPSAPEVCDNKDNNCNGQLDEGVKTAWYLDQDNDGYGAAYNSKESCTQPSGYVAQGGDCNDFNNTIKPGAAELCDSLDNNCNGQIDEGLTQVTVYVDLDGDGHGASSTNGVKTCLLDTNGDGVGDTAPTGYSILKDDCNDSDVTIYTGAAETCDGKDNDCDGTPDRLCLTSCDGSWPFKLDNSYATRAVKSVDLNGDGDFETLVQDDFGFALLDIDGIPLYNYSVSGVYNYSRNNAVFADVDSWDTFSGAVQDIEILTGNGSYPVFYKLKADGTIQTWTNTSSGNYYLYDASRFIASDVDFDGKPEFITNSWCEGNAAAKFYRFDKGTSTITWFKNIADPMNTCQYTDGRMLTDLNGDGVAEFMMSNGYPYATAPNLWGGKIYAYKFTDLSTLAHDFYCPSGVCFNTDITGLYGGGIADLYRMGDEIHSSATYFLTNTNGAANQGTTRYWNYNLDGTAKTGWPSTSTSGTTWWPTDVNDDGVVESVGDILNLGLWDVNNDGYPDQIYGSGSQLRINLWNNTTKSFQEHTPSRLTVSAGTMQVFSIWDMDGDGRLNIISGDSNSNIYCHQLGTATFNRATSLPPQVPWYLRTYQWDNYEPNEGADTNGDGIPDQEPRIASSQTRKGNFYSYLTSASDKDYFIVDAGYNGQICLNSPKGRQYRLKVYSYKDLWNNTTQAAGADGKVDGLVWQGQTSSGGQTCFSGALITPYRYAEYKFVIGIESVVGSSPYWPYWITTPK